MTDLLTTDYDSLVTTNTAEVDQAMLLYQPPKQTPLIKQCIKSATTYPGPLTHSTMSDGLWHTTLCRKVGGISILKQYFFSTQPNQDTIYFMHFLKAIGYKKVKMPLWQLIYYMLWFNWQAGQKSLYFDNPETHNGSSSCPIKYLIPTWRNPLSTKFVPSSVSFLTGLYQLTYRHDNE